MQPHPYRHLPPRQFWRGAVAGALTSGSGMGEFDPVSQVPFQIAPDDAVAAAGSCFAQHIARNLVSAGFHFLQTEAAGPESPFSARFGNIYTARQLIQLMRRAYGLLRPLDQAWRKPDGRWIDPFRPQLLGEGLATAEAVVAARETHFAAVRAMFEQCSVFIFTLGLTEAWLAEDGAALPLPPGALGVAQGASAARFHNFSFDELHLDLELFLADLCLVNPQVRIILTVSPVALAATFEDRHVLVSNTISKSRLRLAAEVMRERHARVCYFPSYEIVTSPVNAADAFEQDMRSVSEAGVARVMALFNRHMLSATAELSSLSATAELSSLSATAERSSLSATAERSSLSATAEPPEPSTHPEGQPVITDAMRADYEARAKILCDEELLAAEGGSAP